MEIYFEFEGKEMIAHGDYEKEVKGTYLDPPSRECFNISKVTYKGVDITGFITCGQLEKIEEYCINRLN